MSLSFLEDVEMSVLVTGRVEIKGDKNPDWIIRGDVFREGGIRKVLVVSIRSRKTRINYEGEVPFQLFLKAMSGDESKAISFHDGTARVVIQNFRAYHGKFIPID